MTDKEYSFAPDEVIVQSWSAKPAGAFSLKTPTGIKVTHKRTNLVVTCDDFRSQHKNRHEAFLILERLLQKQTLENIFKLNYN